MHIGAICTFGQMLHLRWNDHSHSRWPLVISMAAWLMHLVISSNILQLNRVRSRIFLLATGLCRKSHFGEKQDQTGFFFKLVLYLQIPSMGLVWTSDDANSARWCIWCAPFGSSAIQVIARMLWFSQASPFLFALPLPHFSWISKSPFLPNLWLDSMLHLWTWFKLDWILKTSWLKEFLRQNWNTEWLSVLSVQD